MFTGLIRETGEVIRVEDREGGRRLLVRAAAASAELEPGASVAVDGCCLSAERIEVDGFTLFCTPETLSRTTLGRLARGSRVNLELPLRPHDRLGGHFVQGHVDGVGRVLEVRDLGGSWVFRFAAPPSVVRYLVEKGSVAVDGISLTVAALDGEAFDVAVIPETWGRTTLSERKSGDEVNLEADVLAKYVERLLERESAGEGTGTEEAVRRFLDEEGERGS